MKKFNFRKISALTGSLLLTGMTLGTAMAANYPAPFVSGGVANVAIVYGTGAGMSQLDIIQAGNLQSDLQSYMGSTSSSTTTDVEGEAVSLDTSSTRIWLNSSLNVATTVLTEDDLPTVLADTTFSGNVDATLDQTIKILAGGADGGEHSGKVWYGKQPTSSDDPQLGISLGSSTVPLYNATVTMKAIDLSHVDSEGETISLFGRDYVISTATDSDTIVLFSSAEEMTLSIGGASPVPSKTVTISGTEYTIELVSASDTSAWVSVNGDSKEITEGNSKKVGGIDIAVKAADESDALSEATASLLVGTDKITLEAGTTVAKGSDDDPIEGTNVYLSGGVGALTQLSIAVYRPSDPDADTIIAGTPFIDPVFESFKVDFQGVSSPLDDTDRETIKIANSGDDKIQLTMTDSNSNEGTFEFAYNNSGTFNLSDQSSDYIRVREMANLTLYDYTMLGVDDYGHLVEVTQITNSTSGTSTYSNDVIKVKDVLSDDVYQATVTSEGVGTISIDGKSYTVAYGHGSAEEGWVTFKFPTSDSLATTGMVVFPTIETKNGAKLALVEPVEVDFNDFDGAGNDVTRLYFPDGDGWGSAITVDKIVVNAGAAAFAYTVNGINVSNATNDVVNITVGDVSYYVKRMTGGATGTATNKVMIGVKNVTGNADIVKPDAVLTRTSGCRPGVLLFEGKDDDNNYKTVYIDLEQASAGSSTNGVGINDVYFSSSGSKAYYSATLYSDADIEKELDWYGTLVTSDSTDSDQKVATISYPASQIYANVYVGEESASITTTGGTSGSTQLGDVLVTDSEVSSVATKNLIVVGGSCINSAAATLVGGAKCGAAFTEATGAGSGQFILKGYSDSTLTSKIALLVAGYESADTVNAATYLRNKKPDTSKEYLGTSSTAAELVVE